MKKVNKYNTSIGKKIKFARMTNNLTQEELAEEIGISSRYVSQLERGLAFGSANTIVSICKTLNIDSNFLFSDLISENDASSINALIDSKVFQAYMKLNTMNKQIIEIVITQLLKFQDDEPQKSN